MKSRRSTSPLIFALCVIAIVFAALSPLGAFTLLAILPIVYALLAPVATPRLRPALIAVPAAPYLARTSSPRAPPRS